MKVLMANKYFYLKGGCETYYFSLSNLLNERGITVVPFSMKDQKNLKSPFEEAFVENVDYFKASVPKKIHYSGKIIYSFEAKRKIERLLCDTSPDIVHIHNIYHQISPSILKQIKKHNIPIIFTMHDLKILCPNYKMLSRGNLCEKCKQHKYYQCIMNKCVKESTAGSFVNTIEMYLHWLLGSYNNIDVLIAPSKFFRDKLIEYGYPKNKIVYLPNFIDIDMYKPNYESEDYFTYFGRLSEEKGIMTLIKAMKEVASSELYIVGDGPLKDKITSYISEYGITNVKLLGFQAGKDLEYLIKNSKFTIIPSEWYENCPLVVLESMAYGKPVIGSDIGGIPELIDHGSTGLLFESQNFGQLSRHINYLLQNPSIVKDMGVKARRKVENGYSKEVHLKEILNVYGSLLKA